MKQITTICAYLFLFAFILAAQVDPLPVPPGRMVDIGGRRLHLNCSGQGSPTVVLDAGLGDSSLAWTFVQTKLAVTNRVCAYDRAGTAWSHDAGPQHGLSKAAEDLDRLLKASGEHAPYVLVGHSWGGWLVTVYARRHMKNVAGIVLVDSSVGFDPPVIEKMPDSVAGGPPSGPIMIKKATEEDDDPFKRLPPESYRAYRWTQSLVRLPDVDDPYEPLTTVQSATRGNFPLENKPLILIAARHGEDLGDDTDKGKTIRSRILSLSHSSKLLYADSGHYVHLEKPEIVVAAVHEVVDKTRRH